MMRSDCFMALSSICHIDTWMPLFGPPLSASRGPFYCIISPINFWLSMVLFGVYFPRTISRLFSQPYFISSYAKKPLSHPSIIDFWCCIGAFICFSFDEIQPRKNKTKKVEFLIGNFSCTIAFIRTTTASVLSVPNLFYYE